jgi:hypothetical protein
MKRRAIRISRRLAGCLLGACCATQVVAQSTFVPWLTRAHDNGRSGWNSQETVLTQNAVITKGVIRSTIIPLAGDARGMEAQPLISPNVKTPLGVRDVMILPSMANVIRGVDARDGSAIWQVTLDTPVTSSNRIDSKGINQHWGCLSTGVIDAPTQRLYQVCWVSPDKSGNPTTARYYMYVLNVGDGSRVTPPVLLQGGTGTQDFNAQMRKQRAALLETDVKGVRTVFGCSGTVYETAAGAAGYCFAFDTYTNRFTALLPTTAGEGAGIWMGGGGPAADADGYIYLVTGNGDFDGQTQWGESFLKLKYDPPQGNTPASLAVSDHWTPWTDLQRTGQQPAAQMKMAGMSAPSEALKPVGGGMNMSLKNAKRVNSIDERGQPVTLVYPEMAQGAWADEDWGSAGPACIFAIGVCVAAGKDGIGYPIKTAAPGGTTLADLANPATNCAKLAAPPTWLTMSPGPVNACPPDPRTLNFFPWGDTAHLHMTPVQFFDPVLNSWTLFVWGENAQLHKWKIDATGRLTYVAQSHEYASANVRGNAPGGMPGGFCSGSSNGAAADSAILVCTIPYGDANAAVVQGRLLIYDAVHLSADGSLKVLWDSQRWGVGFLFNKFDPPVIDGGQIYVPNYTGGVDLYRLTP